jgi:hypothetical protein
VLDDGSSDFARWLEREERAYFASPGRYATLDGFHEHWIAICKPRSRDPENAVGKHYRRRY